MKALMTRAIAALMSAFIPRWPGPYLSPGWGALPVPNGGRRSGVPAARRAARKRRNRSRRHG